jgi:hypothetical protein
VHEEFIVLPFEVKIQGMVLIGCVWQGLVEPHWFVSGNFLQGESLRSMIGR